MANEIGSGEFLVIFALSLLLVRRKDVRAAGILILAGCTLAYHAGHFIKEYIALPRPFIALKDVSLLAYENGFTFPSIHCAYAFMAATVLAGFFKRYVLFFAIATLAGISRIYIGVHYPLDVIGGAALGIMVGLILLGVYKEIAGKSS
jgi:undecaprenyl-diphosphatase